jgi:hypothetical protein
VICVGCHFPQEERRRDRRGRGRSGRGGDSAEVAVAPVKAAEPRETHKMLQVWTITVPMYIGVCFC